MDNDDNYIDDDDNEGTIAGDDDDIEFEIDPYFINPSESSDDESGFRGASVTMDSESDLPKANLLIDNFSLEKFSQELINKIDSNDLINCLNLHWKVFVPNCFDIFENPTKNLIENNTNKILFKPLENYLCNNLDGETYLKSLNKLDDPPVVCGKGFKAGEASYLCRDCGSDPTCVLCSDCFRLSKHRYHRYKIVTSAGGGYCDCGDPEAWKNDPYCESHTPKPKLDKSNNSESNLPVDLIERSKKLFNYLLKYVYEITSLENIEILPDNLKPDTFDDDFVIMLYNDEIHSYDQVISTLKKSLNVDDKKAYEYAAVVDKEGRSTLKRTKKVDCLNIKTKITESNTNGSSGPLKSKIFHSSLVCHQYFAERIMNWLIDISKYSNGIKNIICKIGLDKLEGSTESNIIEKMMMVDNILWKSAREIIHQFYKSIYLMEPNWKREFATAYTKNYRYIWKNYVKNPDDTVSLTDLSVQMFTVISLSKYLISKYNILQIIMDCIIEHCKTSKGKLKFENTRQRQRNNIFNIEFKRAQSILFDFKYCLTVVPNNWEEDLRKNFINGFKSFIEFNKLMHGMDSIERFTQQHIEFEPEWETSFNLLIKLQRSTALIIEWCSADKLAFIDCFKYLLNSIQQVEIDDSMFQYKFEKKKFQNQVYEIIDYSVFSNKVSIHAPLTRLIASLYSQMSKFEENFNSLLDLMNKNNSPNPLNKNKQKMIGLIEPSIRALVLVFQTNCGLWKRNGFSLISQVYFYTNIKCRTELFDKDILALQMGASFLDPNEFLINILYRFNLYDYFINSNFEIPKSDCPDYYQLQYLIPLVEDFLELLIHIICERYEPNLSLINSIDKLEHETIHQLCISPMAHSDLVKNLYAESERYTTDLETVLYKIANFKNSSGTNTKGKYEIKDEYIKYYNPYFYHYLKSDKTKSEEYILGLKKQEKDKFFIPPILPTWTDLFQNIRNLLGCDIFIQMILNCITRYQNKSNLISEGIVGRILYLIGIAINEEKNDNLKSFKFLNKSNLDKNLINCLNDISNDLNIVNTFKLLADWIKDQYNLILKEEEIELKKDETNDEINNSFKEKSKNQLAEKRKLKVLAQITKMQEKFINKNKDLYDVTETKHSNNENEMQWPNLNIIETPSDRIVCIGPKQTIYKSESLKTSYCCILCQEDQKISINKSPMVLCCYVQNCKILSKNRDKTIPDIEKFDPLFMENSLYWGINTTSCGHVMHGSCWQKYIDNIRLSDNRRHTRSFGFSIKRNEYLCPLCETIGNCALPIFPDLRSFAKTEISEIAISYDDWLDGLEKTLENSVNKELQDDKDVFIINPCPLSTITKLMADAVASNFKLLFEFDPRLLSINPSTSTDIDMKDESINLNNETIDIMESFVRITYSFGLITYPDDTNPRMPIVLWINCAYTIQIIEQLLRIDSKPLFGNLNFKQSDLLSNIVRQSALFGISKHSDSVRKICVRLLASILPYKTGIYEDDSIDLMQIDLFHFLVSLCSAMPNLYDKPQLTSVACGGINDCNIFRLVLQAHCVQIILTKLKSDLFDNFEISDLENSDEPEFIKFFNFFKFIIENKPFDFKIDDKYLKNINQTGKYIYQLLKSSLIPFLRCCALFYSNLTNIVPTITITSEETDENFNELILFMGISNNLSDILDISSNSFKNLCNGWLKNLKNKINLENYINFIELPLKINKFADLPVDYVDLIALSNFKLHDSAIDGESSSIMCLICGKMLGKSNGQLEIGKKRVGACTAHAYKCSGSVGVFLRISECQVLLLHLNMNSEDDILVRGSLTAAPYIDDYGETDQGLRRGNPLRLCKNRYQKLYEDWLSNSIPNIVSRSYQNNQATIMTIDYHQL